MTTERNYDPACFNVRYMAFEDDVNVEKQVTYTILQQNPW